MKIKLYLLLLLCGCSFYTKYHIPYIDYNETKYLTYGMTMYEVQNIIGEPLYVKSISLNDKDEVEHAYSVRTIMVKNNSLINDNPQKAIFNKYDKSKGLLDRNLPSNELHTMILVYDTDDTGTEFLKKAYIEESKNKDRVHLDIFKILSVAIPYSVIIFLIGVAI